MTNRLRKMQGSFSFKNDNIYFCVLEPSIHIHITRSSDGDTGFISFVRPATDTTPVSRIEFIYTNANLTLNAGNAHSNSCKHQFAKRTTRSRRSATTQRVYHYVDEFVCHLTRWRGTVPSECPASAFNAGSNTAAVWDHQKAETGATPR